MLSICHDDVLRRTVLDRTKREELGVAAAIIVVLHLWFRKRHRDAVRLHCEQIDLEDDEEEVPLRLGLRY